MDLYSNLVEAEQRLVALVSSIEADSYSSPTPCDRWDVRALLSHALASIDAFAAAVDGAPGPDMAQVFSGADIVGDDPLGATQRITRRSQAAWSTVRDLNAELSTFIGVMPAGQALAIITFSTVVHGWDLAVATGRPANSRSTWPKRPNRWRPNWFPSCVRGACSHTTST